MCDEKIFQNVSKYKTITARGYTVAFAGGRK